MSSNLNVEGELNRQLQGMNARVMQAEHNLAGMHMVVSRLREIVQASIPALSELEPQLNKLPSGLEQTANYASGQLTNYVQTILNQSVGKFSTPTLSAISDAAGALLEDQLQGIANQIAAAIQANPVVSLVDGLKGNIAALQAQEQTPAIAGQISALQSEVAALTAANPIIGQVADMRAAAATVAGNISTYTSFLSGQKNLIAGITRSFKVGK